MKDAKRLFHGGDNRPEEARATIELAVSTSVRSVANFAGLSAMLSMLKACASNIAVVNIDSRFRGTYMAGLIADQVSVWYNSEDVQ